jgi:hypothetical protein
MCRWLMVPKAAAGLPMHVLEAAHGGGRIHVTSLVAMPVSQSLLAVLSLHVTTCHHTLRELHVGVGMEGRVPPAAHR